MHNIPFKKLNFFFQSIDEASEDVAKELGVKIDHGPHNVRTLSIPGIQDQDLIDLENQRREQEQQQKQLQQQQQQQQQLRVSKIILSSFRKQVICRKTLRRCY